MKENVRNQLNAIRLERDITQSDLAAAVGVSRQTIIAIEKGHYLPSIALALKIARFFKKSVEDIFYLHS